MADYLRFIAVQCVHVGLLIAAFNINIGKCLHMMSRDQVYLVHLGETVDIDCEFDTKYFNLFNNPVLWIKSQLHEKSRVNIMSNINQPFVSTGRFKVVFLPSPPRYRVVLTVTNVTVEDSGNYTCEIRGPETAVLGSVSHSLYTRVYVEDLVLSRDNCSEACTPPALATVTFTENDPSFLQCAAFGGMPRPDVRVFIDDFDITYRFTPHIGSYLSGSKGLRAIHNAVFMRSVYMVLDARDDGKQLRCTAGVTGLPTNVTIATLQINFAPVIRCESRAAFENERHVYLTCEVRARPRTERVFWVVSANGTVVAEGAATSQHWTLVYDREDGVTEVTLYINKARREHFRIYTIVAENVVGQSAMKVQLLRKNRKKFGGRDFSVQHIVTDKRSQGYKDYKPIASCGLPERTYNCYLSLLISALLLIAMLQVKPHSIFE